MVNVKCLAHKDQLWTFQLEYPRYIHGEFLTHRAFSRNSCSSRAMPVEKVLEDLEKNYVYPKEVYKNCPGMSGKEHLDVIEDMKFKLLWSKACKNACKVAKEMVELGAHKQHINRILEPFQMMRTIVTATEWDNFFKLRLSSDAQPEIMELAGAIKNCMTSEGHFNRNCFKLNDNVWTLPYITNKEVYTYRENKSLDETDLLYASAGRCARVSYCNHDGTACDIKKDIALAKRLIMAGHMSPFEHVVCTEGWAFRNYNLTFGFCSFRYILEHTN